MKGKKYSKELSDKEAGEKYRLLQAQQLIDSIMIMLPKTGKKKTKGRSEFETVRVPIVHPKRVQK